MFVAWWAVIGMELLLAEGYVRLGIRGAQTLRAGLEPMQWLAFVALTAFFVYVEGMRALQRRFAPHVIDRALELRASRNTVLRVLAPLYALGVIGGSRQKLARAWAGVLAILLAVFIVRRFPEPWRGITDVAVSAALVWGAVALLVQALRRLRA